MLRIQATAADVSRPPEKAIPTRSPIGNEVRTRCDDGLPDMGRTLSVRVSASGIVRDANDETHDR